MDVANLVRIHEARVAHHVAAVGEIDGENRAAAVLDRRRSVPVDQLVTQRAEIAPGIARLDDAAELAILKRIALFPRLLEAAAAAHEPHRIAFYLYELASEFHAQWTRGKDLPHLRFIIQDDPQLTLARLALVQGVVTVLASGLELLGVKAPEEMR